MLFQSAIRKELARSFGATLVVLFTIVITMLLIRTLGLASRGSVDPQEVVLVLGYTVLGRLPVLLTLALFASIVSTLSRMHGESEMVIWHNSGVGLGGFLGPILRFAWPVLLAIALLVLFVWPWANIQTEELRGRFENRGDLERVAPGQFQESASGRRVFFIDKDSPDGKEGRNVFISTTQPDGSENVTSARSGRIDWINDRQFLLLDNGQRLDRSRDGQELKISEFEHYGTQVGESSALLNPGRLPKSMATFALLRNLDDPYARGELGWRLGMILTALNFILIALAVSSANPRAGRGGNLAFTLFAFVFYYNFLSLGLGWVSTGLVTLPVMLLGLHGSAFALASAWLLKRHTQWHVKDWLRRSPEVQS